MALAAMTAKARPKRQYTQAERLGAIVIAVRESVMEASRQLGVPENTMRTWLAEAGGINEIRALANARAEDALSEAEVAVYREIKQRMTEHTGPDAELHTTFRTLIKSRLGDGAAPADGKAGAAANAQAVVHNWSINANE